MAILERLGCEGPALTNWTWESARLSLGRPFLKLSLRRFAQGSEAAFRAEVLLKAFKEGGRGCSPPRRLRFLQDFGHLVLGTIGLDDEQVQILDEGLHGLDGGVTLVDPVLGAGAVVAPDACLVQIGKQ